jgi:hypothetical protein
MRSVVKILRTWPVAILAAAMLFYGIIVQIAPSVLLIEIGDGFAAPMAFAAFLVYGRALIRSLGLRERPDYIDFLLFGVAGLALINSIDRTLRLADRLGLIVIFNSPIIGGLLVALTFFAALHIVVCGDRAQTVQQKTQPWIWSGKRVVVCALAWGVFFAVLLTARHYWI